jgi:hypothetical protein
VGTGVWTHVWHTYLAVVSEVWADGVDYAREQQEETITYSGGGRGCLNGGMGRGFLVPGGADEGAKVGGSQTAGLSWANAPM